MKLTIAVCTYRRFDRLKLCLNRLKEQSVPQTEYAILVVDNSLLPDESQAFRDSLYGFANLEYVITTKCGIAFARNEAVSLCKTDILAFTDDDCIVSKDWVQNILDVFGRHGDGVAVIGGRLYPLWEKEPPEWLKGSLMHSLALIDWGDREMLIEDVQRTWLLTANAAYRVAALRRAGGFPEHLGRKRRLPLAQEEFAANQAIRSVGYDMVYAPSLTVSHFIPHARISQSNFCKDAFWDGVSQALYRREGLDGDDTDRLADILLPIQEKLVDANLFFETEEAIEEKRQFLRKTGFNETAALIEKNKTVDPMFTNAWPVVYIVTPCLNAVETIDQTIISVITQAGAFSIRYHIQDGGSTDGTIKKLDQWKACIEKNSIPWQCNNVVFTFASCPDRGMYDAVSSGFETMIIPPNAFMTWINADDILMPGALALVQSVAANYRPEQISWLSGAAHIIKNQMTITQANNPNPTLSIKNGLCDGSHWNFVQQEGTFFRKWLWKKSDAANEIRKFKYAGDWCLWRLFAHHADLVQVPWALGAFRMHDRQISNVYADAYQKEIESVVSSETRDRALKSLAEQPIKRSVLKFRYPSGRMDLIEEDASKQAHHFYHKFFGTADLPPERHAPAQTTPSVVQTLKKPEPKAGFISDKRADRISPRIDLANFHHFTYARRSHWPLFEGRDAELFGARMDPDIQQLKIYQDLLVFTFIKDHVPPGSRILDVGGGLSRILKYFARTHDCWNIDKLEGIGNGPKDIGSVPYHLIRDYMGNFNPWLPDNHFDFVFSLSALEHVPEDNPALFDRIIDDINRVLKPGGYSLHLFDVIFKRNGFWTNKFIYHIFDRVKTVNRFIPPDEIRDDPDLYCMSESAYNKTWFKTIQKAYLDHGRPSNITILWKKEMPSGGNELQAGKNSMVAQLPNSSAFRFTIVTPCLNAVATIDQTIESVVTQSGAFVIHYHIQDGGSTDGTVNRLKYWETELSHNNSFVRCHGVRFTWSSEPDQGMYDALLRGFESSLIGPDDFMTWINGDDILMPNALSTVRKISETCPHIRWIGGPTYVIDDNGPILQRDNVTATEIIREGLCDGHHWPHLQQEGIFFKKSLWFAGKHALRGFKLAGDWNLWRIFAQHAEYFQFVDPLGAFRRRKGQLSIKRIADYQMEIDDNIPEFIRYQSFCKLFNQPSPERSVIGLETPVGSVVLKKDSDAVQKQFELNWKKVHNSQQHKKIKEILFLGFSVTEQKNGYFERVRDKFLIRHKDALHLTRTGLGGFQPDHAQYLFPSIIRSSSADMVVLEISTAAFRNYPQFYSAEEYLVTFLSLIAVLHLHGRSVVVIDLFRKDVDYENDWASNIHEAICSKLGIPYLNIAKEIYGDADLVREYLKDGIHTTPRGSDYYASRISEYLFRQLDDQGSRQNVRNNQSFNVLATAFDAIPCKFMVGKPDEYEAYLYERAGFSETLVEIPEGRSIEMKLPENLWVCGFTYLMHPLSGYVDYAIDGERHGKILAYDMHSYYSRLQASVFTPCKAKKIALAQLAGIPPVDLLKGDKQEGSRIGRFGHVFVQRCDRQKLKECVKDFKENAG